MNKDRREWIGTLTTVCVLLGALLGLTMKTQSRRPGIPGINSPEQLTREWWAMQDKILQLQTQLSRSRDGRTTAADEERLTLLAAATPVTGPGIAVTVADNPALSGQKTNPLVNGDLSSVGIGMTHDVEVLSIVNELLAAGAEAISINGQRIGPRTAIRNVGSGIEVNGAGCAAPFRIEAIGDSITLARALELPGGIIAALRNLQCPVDIRQMPRISLTAFHGAVNFPHARRIRSPAKAQVEG